MVSFNNVLFCSKLYLTAHNTTYIEMFSLHTWIFVPLTLKSRIRETIQPLKVPIERLDDLDIPQRMQAIAQTDKHTPTNTDGHSKLYNCPARGRLTR